MLAVYRKDKINTIPVIIKNAQFKKIVFKKAVSVKTYTVCGK
jgi:hypothetical protein